MVDNQNPNYKTITADELSLANLHIHAPAGPKRTKRSRSIARSSPYSVSRHGRARAPSPETLPKLPSTICLLVDCNIEGSHGHSTEEIQERLGWTPTAEDILSGTLTITPITPDPEALFENLCLKITMWRTPGQDGAAVSGWQMASSLLDSRGSGVRDLRLALPDVSNAKGLPRPKRWAFTRGGFAPLLERRELVAGIEIVDGGGTVQEISSEASGDEISKVTDQIAGIDIKSEVQFSSGHPESEGKKPTF